MTTTTQNPPGTATEVLFVYAYHNLPGISDGSWVEYYAPARLEELRQALKSHIEHQLDLFSESYDYEEYFSIAEYGNPRDSISDDELSTFQSALASEDRQTPLHELHPRDVLWGFRAVILKRIAGDLTEVRWAIELFNDIMESAIEAVDNHNARSYVRLQTAREFGPWFIEYLLEAVKALQQTRRQDSYHLFIAEKFSHLKPILDILHPVIHSTAWPHSDLSLGQFLLIVDYYKKVVEDDWHS